VPERASSKVLRCLRIVDRLDLLSPLQVRGPSAKVVEMVPSRDRFSLAGTLLEGRFRVERVVAEGGFGVVYEATQVALDRKVALKVLKTPDIDAAGKVQFVEKFAVEAKTIARMAHPSIVQVYDFGVSTMPSGEPSGWMALEWVTGRTLEADLASRRGFTGRSPEECFGLMKPILEAIAYAHANGIAHRDLKPANIMVQRTDASVVFKVLDFGIAKLMEADELEAAGPTRTPQKLIAYSPAYAAPEQITHARTGPWTDVHALALILVEMLTNEAPFTASDLPSLFSAILTPTRPTPRAKGVDVGGWEPILARALAISPQERFANAGELLRALRTAVVASSDPAASRWTPPPTPPPSPPTASPPVAIATTGMTASQDGRPVVPTHGPSPAFLAGVGAVVLVVLGAGIIGWRLTRAAASAGNDAGLVPAPPASSSAPVLPPPSVSASVSAPIPASSSAEVTPSSKPPLAPPNPAVPRPNPPSSGKRPVPVE
jgi:eukaryotic-like serine/threonine-protein kinase